MGLDFTAAANGEMEPTAVPGSDMFAREHRLRLSELCTDVDEYVDSLNISQG